MLRKMLILILCVMFTFLPALAQGEEDAYPACQGVVTDLAAVLSSDTVKDLETLSSRLSDSAGGNLYVVTRHFLGGKDVRDYAKKLFSAWALQSGDALLLLVIGEETYALQLGDTARAALPDETADAYLGQYFRTDYLNRQYDSAVGALCVRLAVRLAEKQGKTLRTDGLFGSADAAPQMSLGQVWSGLFSTDTTETASSADSENVIVREDKTTGFSFWKTVLVIWIVYMIFFRRKKRRRFDFGHPPRG